MFEQLFAIIRNTFFESIRQPVMLVVLLVATILIILSNPLSAFTMEDDQRMLIDIGLATVFTGGALLAAFIATSVLTREIENKTALTVISKPVGRPLFVIGKYLGVAGAMTMGTALMSFVFLLTEQHTVLQTVREPVHLPVITFGVLAAVVSVGVGVWCNYFYGMAFSSTVICTATPLTGLAYLFALLFRPDFTTQPISTSFKLELWLALICLLVAILVLTAIAVAASTRFGQVMTLVVTLGVFSLGLLSDHFFGNTMHELESLWLERAVTAGLTEEVTEVRRIELTNGEFREIDVTFDRPTVPLFRLADHPGPIADLENVGAGRQSIHERFVFIFARVGHTVLPNFQVMWLADALTQKHVIPLDYVVQSVTYGLLYIVVVLSLAVILFQTREVG